MRILTLLALVGLLSLSLTSGTSSVMNPVQQEGCTIILHNEYAGDACVTGYLYDCNPDESLVDNCCFHAHLAMNWKVCMDSFAQTGKKCDPTVPKTKKYYPAEDSWCDNNSCHHGGWGSCGTHYEEEDKLVECES